jgi:hypothetical protein
MSHNAPPPAKLTGSSIIFNGKSGERYRFQVWPIATKFKALAAVYIVTKRTFDDPTFATKASHHALAIGETANLGAAFFTKPELEALIAQGADYICVCAVADASERAKVAKDVVEGNELASGPLRYLFHVAAAPQKPGPPPETST